MCINFQALLPFAVVGSTDFVRVGNKVVRARQYPWGTVIGKCFICCVLFNLLNVKSWILDF